MSKKKDAISYVKPEEPKFLKEIKQKLGYKEGPTVEDKRNLDKNFISDDENDNDDKAVKEKPEEQPQIVVLNEGDIGESEYKQLMKKAEVAEDKRKIEAGEIKFKKPIRNAGDESASEVTANDSKSSRKRQHQGDNHDNKVSAKNVKAIKENRLLSFADDMEENEDI